EDPKVCPESMKSEDCDGYGTWAVHGIPLSKGEHKGGLVSPNYFTVREDGNRKDYSHVIYSDDHGKTWQAGSQTVESGVGECTVAELSDGKLMLNLRTGSGTARNFCVSEDGGKTWGPMQTDYNLIDPSSQGSLFTDHGDGELPLYFANAASVERKN